MSDDDDVVGDCARMEVWLSTISRLDYCGGKQRVRSSLSLSYVSLAIGKID